MQNESLVTKTNAMRELFLQLHLIGLSQTGSIRFTSQLRYRAGYHKASLFFLYVIVLRFNLFVLNLLYLFQIGE